MSKIWKWKVAVSVCTCVFFYIISLEFSILSKFVFVEEKDDSNDSKNSKKSSDIKESNVAKDPPKLVKSKAKLISPQLLACKIEMNKVEVPPALRQRNIQIQALQASRSSAELLTPQPVMMASVQNDLRHRKKAVIIEDVNHLSSTGSTTSDDDSGSDENAHFDTYLIIEFSAGIQKKTLHWIIDKIRTKVSRGGAGLLIRREPQTKLVFFLIFIYVPFEKQNSNILL